ncbi:hypothetical protein HDK77DRAFT_474136 [Phyllosticta capitalensis]
MATPDKAALDAILDAHLSNLKSHQAIMRQMRDYVAGIQSAQATPHVRVAEELNQMNQRAEKILQDARRAGELMEHLHIRDSPSSSNGIQAQTQATSSTQTNPSAKPAGGRSKYDIEPEIVGNAAKRQRISEHPNLYMPAFPPVLPPFPNGMPKSFQSMRPSWHKSVFPEETKDEGSMQNRIIVANIPPGVDENDIRKHFESIGPITFKHPLRLPRLAETKIHGLTGVCKSRYMATLDLSDYQAANRAAKELDGTHVKSTYYEPIIVRHFCAPSTAPAAGAKHRLSSDSASTFSPSTGPQKRPRVDVDVVGQSANPTNGTVPEPSPSSSATAQPKKRQADTVPVVVKASNSTETASSAATATTPSSGKKPRLDTAPEVSAQQKPRAQPHEDQQTQKPDPHTNSNSITIHPAYASSESLALRSEFDDISNEVDRRLAEAKARREMAHKAVKAKARAGRKRKRSSFMSAAAEDEDNDPDEYKPSPAEMQGTGTTTPDDQPRKKKTKTTGAAHVEKKRGIKREVDDGGGQKSASAGAAKVDRRQQRKERMRKNSSSGDGESVYASARASPASPTPPPQHQQQASPAARASKRVRTKTTKEGCIRF